MLTCIVVSVDYTDYLSLTLPHNQQFFDRTIVVSSKRDTTVKPLVDRFDNVELFETEAFYKYGAVFNKGLAMEEALDYVGREGWIFHTDADIIVPSSIFTSKIDLTALDKNKLYTARRHFIIDPNDLKPCHYTDESTWPPSPDREKQKIYFSGYFQLFHADARQLKNRLPWFSINWSNAGGYEERMQKAFPGKKDRKIFDFYILHLGPNKINWFGRKSEKATAVKKWTADTIKKHKKATSHNYYKSEKKKNRLNIPKEDYPNWVK